MIKTEKTEACNDNTSGDVTDGEHETLQTKEKHQHNHIIEHGIGHVTDVLQHYMIENEEHGTLHAKEESHMADISQQYRVGGREKGRDLTQSYDKSPYTRRIVKRAK